MHPVDNRRAAHECHTRKGRGDAPDPERPQIQICAAAREEEFEDGEHHPSRRERQGQRQQVERREDGGLIVGEEWRAAECVRIPERKAPRQQFVARETAHRQEQHHGVALESIARPGADRRIAPRRGDARNDVRRDGDAVRPEKRLPEWDNREREKEQRRQHGMRNARGDAQPGSGAGARIVIGIADNKPVSVAGCQSECRWRQ